MGQQELRALTVWRVDGELLEQVRAAYALCCSCSCSLEAAARGECHRVWAAQILAEAGWRVILDGVEVGR